MEPSTKKSIRMIGHDYEEYERDLISQKKTFTEKLSGYTTIIETEKFKWMFSDDFKEDQDFTFVDVAEAIKKDIDTIAPHIDEVDQYELMYFDINDNLGSELKLRKAWNVDIKNCYPKTAFNYGFISQETFDYVNSLRVKSDKHMAFGMLATNYTCFDFTLGELLTPPYSEKNDRHRNYFFALVSEISAVMNQIKTELYKDFIFYWVDGMYFKTEKAAKRAREILAENQFDSSFDLLPNFKLYLDDFRYIIEFGSKPDTKCFTVPKIEKDAFKHIHINELIKTYANRALQSV